VRGLAGQQGDAGRTEVDRVAQARAITHVGRSGRWLDDLDGDGLVAMSDDEEDVLSVARASLQQVATGDRPQSGGEAPGE
jgi:hypothetical protein